MLVVRNHGWPSKKGYEPGASSCKMMVETVKVCPPKVNSKFRIRSMGQTDRVSAIYNQKGHDSHSVMLSLKQVASLMTFKPHPPSIMQSETCCPRTRIWINGFCESIKGGPLAGAVRCTVGCTMFRAVREWIFSLNRGSR